MFLIGALLASIGAPLQALPPAEPPSGSLELTQPQLQKLAALRAASEDGLDPADYDVDELDTLAAGTAPDGGQRLLALLDRAYEAFEQDLAYGRLNPAVVDSDWHIPVPTRPEEVGAAAPAPPNSAYRRLREAMVAYLAIRRDGSWPQIPAGPALAVGIRDARVEIARDRLRLTGDFTGDTQADAWMFGAGLDAAVRRFQARHGLSVDGVIGESTRAVMNVPVEARIRQLAIAMERWRWLPRDLGDEYVWINAAELRLEVFRHGKSVLSARTIVGHSTRPTPSLRSEIRQIVFNPSWTVPPTIATEDLLPKLRNTPGYLERYGYRVYTGWDEDDLEIDPARIDWATVSADRLPYRFVQAPGPNNSLGRIKVVFDNEFDIYVHDTPSKGLFDLRTRMFSSGCVRLESADTFADYLLANYREPDGGTAEDWLSDTATRVVNLDRRLPIYVVYITSWVTEDGVVNFRRDLYRRDEALAEAMWAGIGVRRQLVSGR